jgi:hypothetical protein
MALMEFTPCCGIGSDRCKQYWDNVYRAKANRPTRDTWINNFSTRNRENSGMSDITLEFRGAKTGPDGSTINHLAIVWEPHKEDGPQGWSCIVGVY